MSQEKLFKILRSIKIILYICFVFLWFKGNIYPLKRIKISPLVPFIPLMGIICYQLLIKIRHKKIDIAPRFNKVLGGIIVLSVIAVAFRIPYLLHSYGLVTSDDAISALMGKHILEGKLAPICFYGQLYIGSLASHFFALMFKIFGYSIFCFKFSTFLLYLGFVIVNFILLKEIFSLSFSFIVSLFYCLPMGDLIIVSFDDTLICPTVLFLGISLVYISYLISYKKQEKLIPFLGFLIGISFWTHQMSGYFIVASLILIIFNTEFRWKRYVTLAFYALVGFFPQVMQEIYVKFHLVKFLSAGEKGISWNKVKATGKLMVSLISKNNDRSSYLFLLLILFGFIVLLYFAFKKKKFSPQNIYNLFFVLYFLMYFFSGFSNRYLIRYLYPLYFCLPVLLLSGFLIFRSKIKYALASVLVIATFIFYNLKGNTAYYGEVKDLHFSLKQAAIALEETGVRYWRGSYWAAYLMTALAKEKVIVDSYTINRYFPYQLLYYNQNKKDNYLFLFLKELGPEERNRAQYLIDVLNALGADYKKKETKECWLIYNIEGVVFPRIPSGVVPAHLPQLELAEVKSLKGYVQMVFKNNGPNEDIWFRINAEIPGYSTASKRFSMKNKEIAVKIPCPEEASVKIKYYVDYQGIKIPSTIRETSFQPSAAEFEKVKERITFLSGFGPTIEFINRKMRICEKEVKFKLNISRGGKESVRIYLYSPLEFSHLHWYGDYFQKVDVSVNSSLLSSTTLKDGENVIDFELNSASLRKSDNIISLKFKYHLPFGFAPYWKVAALLERVEVKLQK